MICVEIFLNVTLCHWKVLQHSNYQPTVQSMEFCIYYQLHVMYQYQTNWKRNQLIFQLLINILICPPCEGRLISSAKTEDDNRERRGKILAAAAESVQMLFATAAVVRAGVYISDCSAWAEAKYQLCLQQHV